MTATVLTLHQQDPAPEHPLTPGLLREVAAAVRLGDTEHAAALCAQIPPEYDDEEFGRHVPLCFHAVSLPGYKGTAVTVSISDAAVVVRLVHALGLRFEDRWAPWSMPVVSDRYATVLDGLRVQVLHWYPAGD